MMLSMHSHTAGEREAVGAPFERRDVALERLAGRILPRAYSYPLFDPSASCTYVDVRYTGDMIAPASGSGR